VITIGVDPHKSSHTAVALDAGGAVMAEVRLVATKAATSNALAWAKPWPERTWAIEGAAGLGQLLAQQLVAAGERVVDVPCTLAAKARLLDAGHGRKTDSLDAACVARVAQQRSGLRQVVPEDHTRVLRLLSDRRNEIAEERRRSVNRLHRLFRDLRPGGAPIGLSADTATKLLNAVHPQTVVDAERKTMARELIADVRRLDRALELNRSRCKEAVAISGTSLTQVFGISDVLAAKILGQAGDVTRFKSADHFASYTGTAPIEASSGPIVRHRLSRAGNRQLNHALHLAARVQAIHPNPGQTYYQRKLAEAKTRQEALRCLKRQIAKTVYRVLLADHQRLRIVGD
jgi:transposase